MEFSKMATKARLMIRILFHLGIGHPGRHLPPGHDMCFWDHRSPSTVVLTTILQGLSLGASFIFTLGSSFTETGCFFTSQPASFMKLREAGLFK